MARGSPGSFRRSALRFRIGRQPAGALSGRVQDTMVRGRYLLVRFRESWLPHLQEQEMRSPLPISESRRRACAQARRLSAREFHPRLHSTESSNSGNATGGEFLPVSISIAHATIVAAVPVCIVTVTLL